MEKHIRECLNPENENAFVFELGKVNLHCLHFVGIGFPDRPRTIERDEICSIFKCRKCNHIKLLFSLPVIGVRNIFGKAPNLCGVNW